MRIPGRFWWVMALSACIFVAAPIVVPTLSLSSFIQIDSELGGSFLKTDLWFATYLLLVLLLPSLIIAWFAARSLYGYRRRRRALRGDMDALALAAPPASVGGDTPQQPEVPLVVQWRRKRWVLLFLVFYLVLFMAMGLGNAFDIYMLIQHANTSVYLTSDALLLILIITMFIVFIVLIIFEFVVARIVWFQWRHAFGVTATEEGLECVTSNGRRTFIPWSEARLFEVEKRSHGALAPRVWRLYGSGDVATWVYDPLARAAIPSGASAVEMKLRQDALTRLITTHTGLAPRILSKSLITTSSPALRRLWSIAAFYTLFIVITLALAVAVIVTPLTDTPWLNVAFSPPLVAATIQMARRLRRSLRALSQQSLHSNVRQDSALIFSLKDDSLQGKVYALWFGPSRAARTRSFLFGALLATELLPAIQTVLSIPSPDALPTLHFSLSTMPPPLPSLALTSVLVVALGVYGVLGLLICFFAIYRSGPTIRADDLGLSMSAGTFTATYPWSDIGEIREIVEGAKVVSYTVHNRAGNILFRWSANPANTAPLAHLPNAEPISPAALAQLVSQRIDGAEN